MSTATGYIYFASNPSMAGVLKIGRTKAPPTKRLGELHTTGVPTPFILDASFRVTDSFSAEERIHALLLAQRVSAGREFFAISAAEALRLSSSVLVEFMYVASDSPAAATSSASLETIEEELLVHISSHGGLSRAHEYEIERQFSLSHTRATLHLGRLIKRGYIRARRHDPHLPYYEIEHDGIQYLIDHHLVDAEKL